MTWLLFFGENTFFVSSEPSPREKINMEQCFKLIYNWILRNILTETIANKRFHMSTTLMGSLHDFNH